MMIPYAGIAWSIWYITPKNDYLVLLDDDNNIYFYIENNASLLLIGMDNDSYCEGTNILLVPYSPSDYSP